MRILKIDQTIDWRAPGGTPDPLPRKGMKLTCATCGNPVQAGTPVCPHCGGYERVESTRGSSDVRFRTVDLGHRRLAAAEAVRRLGDEIDRAGLSGTRYLRIVHGHGSTGRGGVIRTAVRAELAKLRGQKRIAGFIAGEKLSSDANEGRAFASRHPEARSWADWNAGNEGVTFVAFP